MKINTLFGSVHIAVVMLLTIVPIPGADWPQYRGLNQDGISEETLNPVLTAGGPKLLWKISVNGYGSFAISGGKAFALTSRGKNGETRELCIALDASTGKELWSADVAFGKYSPDGEKNGDGPRSTPAVNNGKVYVYSTDAKLCCFEAQTGKELWRLDVLKDHDGMGQIPKWGNSSSPVVDGDLVMVAGGGVGQSVLAVNKNSGQVAWKKGDEQTDFNTPIVVTIHDERQVIFNLGHKLSGISVKDGKILWRKGVPWHEATSPYLQPYPIVYKDRVWYGNSLSGCTLFQLVKWEDGFFGKWIWDMNIGNQNLPYSTPVLRDGYIYGTFGRTPDGKKTEIQLKCLELASDRKVKWAKKGFGYNDSVILVGDKLVVLSELGDVVVTELRPDAYKELARFKALEGKCYSTPAFSNGRIYIRSIKECVCYDLSAK